MREVFRKFIAQIEATSLTSAILFGSFFIFLRNFLEQYSDAYPANWAAFGHYFVSYWAVGLTAAAVLHLIFKIQVGKLLRVIPFTFLLLPLTPVIDMVVSGGMDISYLSPRSLSEFVALFLTYFGPITERGVTIGMRLEIALFLIFSAFYVYFATSSILRALLASLSSYVLIFFFITMPFLLERGFSILKITHVYDDWFFFKFYVLLLLMASGFLFFVDQKKWFLMMLKDIRPYRLAHYLLMLILGAALIDGVHRVPDQLAFLDWLFLVLAIVYAWIFSVMSNNLEDVQIDRITNPDRPTVIGGVDTATYRKLMWLMGGGALVLGAMVSITAFMVIGLYLGFYFIYSVPPLRIKRIPFFSKSVIALNSLLLFLLGAWFLDPEFIPSLSIVLFFLWLTAPNNFIDLKDTEGDREAGIKTLPVMLGQRRAQLLIGGFYLFTFPLAYAVFSAYFTVNHPVLLLAFLLTGCVQFLLVARKQYQEEPVFFLNLIATAFLVLLVR